MSDISLQLPSANVASNSSALVAFSQAESDLVRNVRCLHPIPSQTGGKSLAITVPQHLQGSPEVLLGPQITAQQVRQRAREALNVQRETARRTVLRQQEQ